MHVDFLREALHLARARQGMAGSNPSVGAIVVKDGIVLSRGFHWGSGHPHAEVEALKHLGDAAQGATIYVSLEPCCFAGKTPACTDLLIARGLSGVVFAYEDPNPKVAGRGAKLLQAAGISVEHVPLPEAEVFYESYSHWTRTGLPFVIAKLALSLDGKTCASDGSPVALTGEDAARFTHEGRKRANAILTTARTIHSDDPRLNVRLSEVPLYKPIYVLDDRLETSLSSRVFNSKSVTLLHGPFTGVFPVFNPDTKLKEVPRNSSNQLCLESVVSAIGADGHHELWVEAGGTLFGHLWAEKKLQKAYLYLAPKWLGDAGKIAFETPFGVCEIGAHVSWSALGMDGLCEIKMR